MATKNRIAYALPIIQIMWRLLAKSPIQNCLRLVYGERVGIIKTGTKTLKYRGFRAFLFFERTKNVLNYEFIEFFGCFTMLIWVQMGISV